jgi:aspartyl-tRNA(Asn)/glutamyl-tRNA(Gln) amidotransferase subunit B
MSDYKLTIGIETHVQLKTKTKLFSGSDNDDRDTLPNTVVNHIDFGMPGALPVLNEKAVDLATKAAFALNTKPQKYSKFDRKHYFYPDLPMGYQISQYDEPIILGGFVDIYLDGEKKRIGITRAHLEADAGKSIHPNHKDYSLVDLNRSGTPLLEIVSEPEMHSAAEARAYAKELYLLMKFAGVSNANLFYGNMRFDVNVSVSKDDTLGTRAEIKNLNSFRSVEKAVEFEYKRQVVLLESGEKIVQETRGWDDSKNITYSMRSKENAEDYRYMPEPDVPPIELTDEQIEEVEKTMPVLPFTLREKLLEKNIDPSIIDVLLESDAEYSLENSKWIIDSSDAKQIANFIVNIEVPLRAKETEIKLSDENRLSAYNQVIELLDNNKLSSSNAKILLEEVLLSSDVDNIEEFADKKGLLQTVNTDDIMRFVEQVVSANPKAIEDIKSGQDKAIGFLVGQVMRLSQGKTNPEVAKQLISDHIKTL